MRLTHALTLAALAGASLPAAAQNARSRSDDARILRVPGIRMATGFGDESRAALGIGTRVTGTPRDTLGLLITSITRNSPAERAGLEEGNRLAAINGVSLRANASDLQDAEMSNSLTHRLTRELGKVKPGDEVELRVYRDGRTQSLRVKTALSDSLFQRRDVVRISRSDMDNRPALGFGIGSSGSQRDTLGVLVISVSDSTPAAAAGLEEGNRIAAINGVNLRVAREDAGDDYMGNAKAQRLMREISQLAPGSDVTLRVYSDGRFRDVKMKVARAGDLPRRRSMMFLGGAGMMMPEMPAMPPMAPMAPMAPMPPRAMEWPMSDMHFEIGPQIEAALRQAGLELERIRPQLDRVLRDLPATLETIKLPRVQVDVDMQGEVLSLAPARRAAPARVLTTVL
jgi:serine protease Do